MSISDFSAHPNPEAGDDPETALWAAQEAVARPMDMALNDCGEHAPLAPYAVVGLGVSLLADMVEAEDPDEDEDEEDEEDQGD